MNILCIKVHFLANLLKAVNLIFGLNSHKNMSSCLTIASYALFYEIVPPKRDNDSTNIFNFPIFAA